MNVSIDQHGRLFTTMLVPGKGIPTMHVSIVYE